jgi:hypothetical protein
MPEYLRSISVLRSWSVISWGAGPCSSSQSMCETRRRFSDASIERRIASGEKSRTRRVRPDEVTPALVEMMHS